ncbi:hypothetical protein CCAX7_15720 [Capsulimonas corticalis]|uniref:Uncharacterized protein n=1 Tax=Capsulimonas corticalis TaxID=2219043 RepID=A0A402CZ63_9BACT|nr:DUF5335 family protein [Capsulimonas corticalis]BDI29521.1 hypothetical protein CCAX7_15720 [Capsulimonas corticalis]
MPTREIPFTEWKSYLETFSKRHQGAVAKVLVADPSGEHTVVKSLPFVGISLETKGSGDHEIALELGDDATDHETHFIAQPKKLYHKDATTDLSEEINKDEILEVTSATDPPITVIHLRHS